MRDFLSHFVLFCNFGYKIPSLPVLDVLELRVLFALVDLLKLLSDFVHILHGLREPRHSNRSCLGDSDLFMFKLRLCLLEVEVVVFLIRDFETVASLLSFFEVEAVSTKVGEIDFIFGESGA